MSFVKPKSPSSKTPKPLEACEFKKYGCGEMLKADEMERHLRDQMATHLMLVVEKFEQQIEMNTFMMAHFTEQMEEQVEKSMQMIQQTERRQTITESKLGDFMKAYKATPTLSPSPLPSPSPSPAPVDPALLDDIKALTSKQRVQKDAMDAMRTELVHNLDQQTVNLQLLQDRVETNANLLVERLYSQIQNLEDLIRQNVESLDKKIEAKEKSHASYHTLQQERFEQEVSSQVAPLGAQIQQLGQKTSRLQDEAVVNQSQYSHIKENHAVLSRSLDRVQADFNLLQVKMDKLDRPSHRRSSSNLREDSDTSPSSAPASPQPSNVDMKRVENAEAQIKRMDTAQKTLEQSLQDHQTQVDDTVREIKTKLTKHEEAIAYDEKERERQKLEEKKKFELEEKERSKLEDKIKLDVRERIDKVAGPLASLEKQHKALESQAQSTLVEIRDIKEDIEKSRAHNHEVEDKTKTELKELKESVEKLKKREKEENKTTSPLNVSGSDLEQKKKLFEKDQAASKSPIAKAGPLAPPSPATLHPEPPKASSYANSTTSTSSPSSKVDTAPVGSPIIPHIRAENSPANIAKYGEKAILWEFDPIGGQWVRLEISLRMEGKPFAEGALRHAFNAEATGSLSPVDESKFAHPSELFPPADTITPFRHGDSLPLRCDAKTSWVPGAKFVVKVYKKDAEQKASRELYFEDVKMQMVCRDWGNKFNQKKPPKRIEFLMAWVLELVDRSPPVLCNMEPLLIGEFKKNNSNFGAVLNTRSTPQSFSHFTYEHSRKDLIIVDIQGVEDHYTDPQIHTSDGKGYGLGNLGKNGIQRFLSTHKCNAVCALLGLSPIGMGSTRRPQLRGTMVMPDIMPHLPASEIKVGRRRGNIGAEEYHKKELKLVHSLQGHRDRISAVCYLPSEGLVCTASADSTIKVFDPNNGWKCVDTLTSHKKAVECLCANDKYLFSGSADQSIKVWDPKRDFRCVQTLTGHKGEISAICINSKYIISGSFDKTIKIWNVNTFQEIKTLESHTKSVKCLCLAGSYLFSGSNDLLIYVWDLDALTPIFTMEGHEEWVKTVAMAGQSLISGSHDSTIKVWDLSEFNCMQTLKGHRDAVVALLTSGPVVYSGSEDNAIKAWDLDSLECICTVPKAHPLGVQAFTLIDKKLISVSVDGSIKVWEWGLK